MKIFYILSTVFLSCHLGTSEEFCSVIEKKSSKSQPCIFPFKYYGSTYDACTDVNDPDNKLWCSTKVDQDGNHDQSGGHWGHCGQDCSARPLKQNPEFSVSSKDFSKCGENTDPTRLAQSSSVGLWPWMASLGFWSDGQWNHQCGATLVSQSKIITAAHCLYHEDKHKLKVRLGDNNLISNADDKYVQEFEIEEKHEHPKYIKDKAYYDIAVLKIPAVVFTVRVRPICLPNPEVFHINQYEGHASTLIGWGKPSENGKIESTLKRTILTIYGYSYCNETHEKTSGQIATLVKTFLPQLFQPNLLCAGYESANQGSCKGDSGGPLMIFNTSSSQHFQVGIVVGGVSDCGDKYIPAYYTRLNHPEIAGFVQSPENYFSREVIINQGKGILETNEGTQIEKDRTVLNHEERSEGEGETKNKNGTDISNFAQDNMIKGDIFPSTWINDKPPLYIDSNDGLRKDDKIFTIEERKEVYDIPVENMPNSFEYWKDYSYSGVGTYFEGDGSKYDGQIVNGLKNGNGIIFYPNGATYEGGWRDDKFSGMGTFTWPDRSRYVGWHEYGQKNGFGKMFYANGDVYEGYWRYDRRSGKGTMHYINGYKYYGDWVNDVRHGYGVDYYPDGQIYTQGPYQYGNFVG